MSNEFLYTLFLSTRLIRPRERISISLHVEVGWLVRLDHLWHGGIQKIEFAALDATVTGGRCSADPVREGGFEIPCALLFQAKSNEAQR